jgi:hypothetical protein
MTTQEMSDYEIVQQLRIIALTLSDNNGDRAKEAVEVIREAARRIQKNYTK